MGTSAIEGVGATLVAFSASKHAMAARDATALGSVKSRGSPDSQEH